MPRNRGAVIIGHRITVISIENTWTQQEKVHVHVHGTVPLSHIVWLIFKRENGGLVRRFSNYNLIHGIIGKLTWTIQFVKP
jgi:hypothetical protein